MAKESNGQAKNAKNSDGEVANTKEQALIEVAGKYQRLLLGILGLSVIGPLIGVVLLLSAKSSLNERSGTELILSAKNTYNEFRDIDNQRRIAIADVNRTSAGLRLDVAETNIQIMAESLYDKERDIQLFFRLLKVNAYSLTEHMFGIHAWFEKYGAEIDNAIQRSQSRQLRLLRIREYYQDVYVGQ